MKTHEKKITPVLKAWKQSKDALCDDVVNCFKTDLYSIHAALIYLDQLFKKKGLKNDASKLVEKGLEDFDSWRHYYDILRFELIGHRQAKVRYEDEIQKLREEIILLRQDNEINKFGAE